MPMTNSTPEWLMKLSELWERRDTAGFYEFEELFKKTIVGTKKETLEEAKEEIKTIWQKGDWQLETQYGENLLIEILDILKSGGKAQWG